ncbi:cilia- and flagella-associated protein 337-like [Engystomops pustulosus]|uniref:cilia- and flagella-associated protein 337-like n=1 Tax=Engystomops pustulosus TaxID=76066 RepID=UPI003AFAD65C
MMTSSDPSSFAALTHTATCFYYWYDTQSTGGRSLLLWGDEKGGISLLWLLKPKSGLFEKPFTHRSGPSEVYMQDLKLHNDFLSYQSIPDVHSEAITKVMYVASQELLVTSCGSSHNSVVIMDIHQRGNVYTWRIRKGVQCFDYCKTLSLLVTGGLDHKVRLWNQYVPSRPTAILSEHTTAISDVTIYEPLMQVFSYSKDSVLKVWDLSSCRCIQTLVVKFPCIEFGHLKEHGGFSFLLTSCSPRCLVVTYSDYIGLLKLSQNDPSEDNRTTHEAPLSTLLYNGFFHQVVTASDDSSIIVWDVETGNKSLLLRNAHGDEEITCMTLDPSHRKLLTGARDGTIKVTQGQTLLQATRDRRFSRPPGTDASPGHQGQTLLQATRDRRFSRPPGTDASPGHQGQTLLQATRDRRFSRPPGTDTSPGRQGQTLLQAARERRFSRPPGRDASPGHQ